MTEKKQEYQNMTPREAAQAMNQEPDHVLVDVRSPEEYAAGHVAEAISLPVDRIAQEAPGKLPDKNQLILLCCRSGMRSQRAAHQLTEMGYTNLCAFGGVDAWIAEEKGKQQ